MPATRSGHDRVTLSFAMEQADSLPDIPEPAENPFLYGHSAIGHQFAQAWTSGKLHHAALLAGPKGIGKATFAFHLAWHMLKVPNGTADELLAVNPDDPLWRQIASGAHPSVLHITRPPRDTGDGFKQVITVEEIRRLGRFLSMTSQDGLWRIVIIDSAEDMNIAASNALLKNLEEPPAKTLFVLISHSVGKLLPTIRSRTQLHRFQSLEADQLSKVLSSVQADFQPENATLKRLHELCEGSVRKALLLTRHGGLEIADAIEEILSNKDFDEKKSLSMVKALSARGAEIPFDLFNDYITTYVARLAEQSARNGDRDPAQKLAFTWNKIQERISEQNEYNLDKRQHMMGMLVYLHDVLNG